MRKQILGNSDLDVSVVGLGTWAIGGDFWGSVDDKESIKAIQAGMDAGINLIDTAPGYGAGHAERIVGKAIKGRRDQAIVATKCGIIRTPNSFEKNLTPASIRKEVEDSLTRLGVDVIDLYQIHWPDEKTPLEDTVAELIKLREAGKYKCLGVSNFATKLMTSVMSMTGLVSLQPQYSLLHRDIEADVLPFCIEHNIGVLSYGSIGAGILAGKYKEPPIFSGGDHRGDFYPFFKEPIWSKVKLLLAKLEAIAKNNGKPISHVAINWVNEQVGITTALVGARTVAQAVENAKAGDWELTEEELMDINTAYDAIFLS